MPWWLVGLASPLAAIIAGVAAIVLYWKLRLHRSADGTLHTNKMIAMAVNCTNGYIFLVCAIAQLAFSFPVSTVIADGFGETRVAILFVAQLFPIALSLWADFTPPKGA